MEDESDPSFWQGRFFGYLPRFWDTMLVNNRLFHHFLNMDCGSVKIMLQLIHSKFI